MGKKNVSLVVSGAGWLASFADGFIIKALRERGVSDEAIHSLATEGDELTIGKIEDALAEVEQRAKNIFRLMVGENRTTEEVVKAGKYDWVNNYVTGRNFPMRSRAGGKVTIELVDFGRDISSEEAIKKARRRGFERPSYEDALFFGEQFPEKQRERPIIFLHEPWQEDPDCLPFVLVLYGWSSQRRLYLCWFAAEWCRDYVFAFVRK